MITFIIRFNHSEFSMTGAFSLIEKRWTFALHHEKSYVPLTKGQFVEMFKGVRRDNLTIHVSPDNLPWSAKKWH